MSSQGRLTQLACEFLAMLENERGSSEHTLRAYRRELLAFAISLENKFGADCPPREIDHLHIRAYLGELIDRGLQKLPISLDVSLSTHELESVTTCPEVLILAVFSRCTLIASAQAFGCKRGDRL